MYWTKMSDWDCNTIPRDWFHCPRTATKLIRGKFLVFKMPFSSSYNNLIPEECRFTVDMFFAFLKSQKIKLGLWIDLTPTISCYRYDKKSIIDNGCQYIQLQDKTEIPTLKQMRGFVSTCDHFISHNLFDIIGVHCTDGFNRTGLILINYLVETYGISVDAGLIEFAVARPPGIYKGDYIQELYRRYDNMLNVPPSPPKPLWCSKRDDSDVDDANKESSKEINSYDEDMHCKKKKKHKLKLEQIRQLVAGLELGNKKPMELLLEMRQLVGHKGSCQHLYSLWIERLPSHIQEILAIIKEKDILKHAKIADKIFEKENNYEIAKIKLEQITRQKDDSDVDDANKESSKEINSYDEDMRCKKKKKRKLKLEQIKWLVAGLELGDKKPTELLMEIMWKLVGHKINRRCLYNLWIERLPSHVQEILAIIKTEGISKQTRVADKILEEENNFEITKIKLKQITRQKDNSDVDDANEESSRSITGHDKDMHGEKKKCKVRLEQCRPQIAGLELGHKKPTKLLMMIMWQLVGYRDSSRKYLYSLWIECLPSHIQEILAMRKDRGRIFLLKNILKQAKVADEIFEKGNKSGIAAVETCSLRM